MQIVKRRSTLATKYIVLYEAPTLHLTYSDSAQRDYYLPLIILSFKKISLPWSAAYWNSNL